CGICSLVLALDEPILGCSARLQGTVSRSLAVANVLFGSRSGWVLGGNSGLDRLPLNEGTTWWPGSVARSDVTAQPPRSAMKAPSRGGRAVEPLSASTWSSKIRSTESSGSRRSRGLLWSSVGRRLLSETAT